MEDNFVACCVVAACRNPSMRRMPRTQRIAVAWLSEQYLEKCLMFVVCPSEFQAGDLITKQLTDSRVWERYLCLVGHFRIMCLRRHMLVALVVLDLCLMKYSLVCRAEWRTTTLLACRCLLHIAVAAQSQIPLRFSQLVLDQRNIEYTLILSSSYTDSLMNKPRNHWKLRDLVLMLC